MAEHVFAWKTPLTMLSKEYAVLRSILGPVRLTKTDHLILLIRKLAHDCQCLWNETSPTLQVFLLSLCAIWGLLFLEKVSNRLNSLSRRGIPILTRPKNVDRWDYESVLREGRRQYPNTPYIIGYSGYEYVVYPTSCFDEVKRLSMSRASLVEWATHVFFQGWRFLGADNSILHKMISTDLFRAIPLSVQTRYTNVVGACKAVVGCDSDWKSVRLYATAQELVARANAATFMHPSIGTHKWWLWAVQTLPMVCMIGVLVCHQTPCLLRPVVASIVFCPAWAIYWAMEMALLPIVRREVQIFETASNQGQVQTLLTPQPNMPFPITSWLMMRYPREKRSPRQIARDYINIAFESTTATSATVYFVIAELIARPELVSELREEIRQHMVNDQLPSTDLNELQKLDSVIRECARVHPFSHLALHRRVMRPIKLSIGPELPLGALICVDAYHINTSPDLWEKPTEFDPMRFLKLRQRPGHETRHLFTSLGSDSPGFGDGPQACPGRAYASNLIKVILAHLLLHYDMKLDPDSVKPKRNSMPNGSFAPEMRARVLLKPRRPKTSDI